MLGTIVNTCCIIIGSTVGSFLRKGVKEEYQEALFNALGVCTILLGANAFVHNMPESTMPVLFIVSMAVGSLLGYWLDLDEKFDRLIGKLKKKEKQDCNAKNETVRLSEGLSTGILLYCIGTFSMLGPVLSCLSPSHGWEITEQGNTYLYTNATLDLISSAVLSSTYGIGMVWAAPVLFCWQGMFYLLASISADIISTDLVHELSIVGGVLITASGFNILNIKKIKTLNMIPTLFVPPIYFIVKHLLQSL